MYWLGRIQAIDTRWHRRTRSTVKESCKHVHVAMGSHCCCTTVAMWRERCTMKRQSNQLSTPLSADRVLFMSRVEKKGTDLPRPPSVVVGHSPSSNLARRDLPMASHMLAGSCSEHSKSGMHACVISLTTRWGVGVGVGDGDVDSDGRWRAAGP